MVLCFHNRFDANTSDILIGVLAILVTLLVGWQIYRTIDFKEVIEARLEGFAKENNERFSEMRSDLESLATNLRIEISDGIKESTDSSLFISLAQLGTALHNCSQSGNSSFDATSIQVFFNAISKWDDSMNGDLEKEAFQNCLKILKEYANREVELTVSKDDHDFFLQMAMKINDIEIVLFVNNFTIQE